MDRECDAVRTNGLQFHSMRLVVIAKLKTKTIPKRAISKYKIDTGSDGELVLFGMIRLIYPKTTTAEQNEYIKGHITCL